MTIHEIREAIAEPKRIGNDPKTSVRAWVDAANVALDKMEQFLNELQEGMNDEETSYNLRRKQRYT